MLPEEAGRILTQLLHHGPGGGAVAAGGAEGLAAFQKGMQECLRRVLQIKVGQEAVRLDMVGRYEVLLGVVLQLFWHTDHVFSILAPCIRRKRRGFDCLCGNGCFRTSMLAAMEQWKKALPEAIVRVLQPGDGK